MQDETESLEAALAKIEVFLARNSGTSASANSSGREREDAPLAAAEQELVLALADYLDGTPATPGQSSAEDIPPELVARVKARVTVPSSVSATDNTATAMTAIASARHGDRSSSDEIQAEVQRKLGQYRACTILLACLQQPL